MRACLLVLLATLLAAAEPVVTLVAVRDPAKPDKALEALVADKAFAEGLAKTKIVLVADPAAAAAFLAKNAAQIAKQLDTPTLAPGLWGFRDGEPAFAARAVERELTPMAINRLKQVGEAGAKSRQPLKGLIAKVGATCAQFRSEMEGGLATATELVVPAQRKAVAAEARKRARPVAGGILVPAMAGQGSAAEYLVEFAASGLLCRDPEGTTFKLASANGKWLIEAWDDLHLQGK